MFCHYIITSMYNLNVKKMLLIALMAVFATSSQAESKSQKYESLMKDGSKSEIKKAFYKDYFMNKALIGKSKDTLVMTAIKYDRDASIITLLVNAGVNIRKKNNLNQNALMYTCCYSSNEKTIKYVFKKYGSGKKLKKNLLKKDNDGLCAVDYAEKNSCQIPKQLIEECLSNDIQKNNIQDPQIDSTQEKKSEQTNNNDNLTENSDTEKQTPLSETKNPIVESPLTKIPDEPEKTVSASSAPVISAIPATPIPIEEKKVAESEPEKLENSKKNDEIAIFEEKNELKSKKIEPTPTLSPYKKTYLYDYAPKEAEILPSDEEDEEFALISNPNKRDERGRTLLMNAVQSGNEWEARRLIKSKADVNLKDNDGWTALMFASRYQNDADIVDLLIKNGANLEEKNNYGSTALQLSACYSNNPDILKKILDNQKNSANELMKAFIMTITSESNTVEALLAKLKLFIEKGISINRFYEGKTPLMYAAEFSKSTATIKFLIDNGASVSIRDQKGKKAFDYANNNTHLVHDETYWLLNSQ